MTSHCRSLLPRRRDSPMAGSAVLTTEMSRTTRIWAVRARASTAHDRAGSSIGLRLAVRRVVRRGGGAGGCGVGGVHRNSCARVCGRCGTSRWAVGACCVLIGWPEGCRCGPRVTTAVMARTESVEPVRVVEEPDVGGVRDPVGAVRRQGGHPVLGGGPALRAVGVLPGGDDGQRLRVEGGQRLRLGEHVPELGLLVAHVVGAARAGRERLDLRCGARGQGGCCRRAGRGAARRPEPGPGITGSRRRIIA